MKLNKLFILPVAMTLLAGCGNNSEKADPNLYHLTFSSNLSLTSEQKEEIKATYGAGPASLVVVEGQRDEDEIKDLKDAGATDADIEKAGKRQEDGSYYFFDQDPIYLEAPKVKGYKLDGFYNKATGELEDRACVQGPADNRQRTRWNMHNKDTELEVRYAEIKYEITFDNVADDEYNPNTAITDYQYLRDGENIVLADATTTNPLKEFVCWEYQDISFDGPNAPWIKLEGGRLPFDYELDYMRIHAVFEVAKININFAFKKYVEPEVFDTLTYGDVIESMSVNSNLATVDGVAVVPGTKTPVSESSVIKLDGADGWMNIFYVLKENYEIFYFELNGVRNEIINCDRMNPPYVNISKEDITTATSATITFVVSEVI